MKFKKISTIVLSAFMFMSTMFSSTFAGGKYAKVVFLSMMYGGKSSIMYVLSNKRNAPIQTEHTEELIVRERFFEFDENEQHYSVNTKLWDSSAEKRHKELIKDFCQNATVAVICIDLKYVNEAPCTSTLFNKVTDNWLNEIISIAPNCKFVLVGTKRDIFDGDYVALGQARENIERIAGFDQIRQRVGEGEQRRIAYLSAQKDNPQEVCNTLNRLISEAIKDYGLANLQDRPTKMSAKLVKDIPKRRVTKTGTKTVTVTVPKFTEQSFGTFWKTKVNVEDGTTTKSETVSYDYTVLEDNLSAATYRIEYYGEF